MKAELIVDAPILNSKEIWIKKVLKPHFDHPFHFHQFCEIVWVEKSYGKLIIGDYVGNFEEGELIMKAPLLPHLWVCESEFYQNNKDLFTKATGIYFSPELITKITDDKHTLMLYNNLLNNSQRGMRIYGETRKEIIKKIKILRNTNGLARIGHFIQIIDLLTITTEYTLLASLSYTDSTNEKDMDRFDQVYQFILNNFDREITLKEVADVCHMTPNAFCRYFKQRTQKTFTRFLTEIRIGHACRLLQNSDKTVNNIYYECGYNNAANFFRFFKQVTSKTPHKYRKYLHKLENH